MKTKISQFAAAALLTALTATSAHAGFVGRELQVTYYYPDLTTPYTCSTATPVYCATAAPPVFTVGTVPTVETTVNVENVTQIAVDFTDNSLRFDFTTSLTNPTWTASSFNGFVFDLLAGDPLSLASASIDLSSTLVGFDDSRVGWNGNQLTINWNGLSYVNGTSLLINFTSVPEPGSLALLGMALAALAYIARQKLNAKGEQT